LYAWVQVTAAVDVLCMAAQVFNKKGGGGEGSSKAGGVGRGSKSNGGINKTLLIQSHSVASGSEITQTFRIHHKIKHHVVQKGTSTKKNEQIDFRSSLTNCVQSLKYVN